jgi:Prolyl oligopeptidase family
MAGVEATKKLGFVHESKIAVTGWSYGGYTTSWLIGHYHIWKTAVAGASVTDLGEEYNLSDGNVAGRYSFKGSPLGRQEHEGLPRADADYLRGPDQDAHVNPQRYGRRTGPYYAVLPALPRYEGQWSNG